MLTCMPMLILTERGGGGGVGWGKVEIWGRGRKVGESMVMRWWG